MRLLLLLLLSAIGTPSVTAADVIAVDLCQVLRDPAKFAGKLIKVNGFINPLMHGTYLKQAGCGRSILLVLPEEIPKYRGPITIDRDTEFERFLDARSNHLPNASAFSADFAGQLEYKKHGKGFGYNANHRTRLVLQSVSHSRSRM